MTRAVIFYAVLRPLISVNFWLRYHRCAEDKWFWADELAVGWGYFYEPKWLGAALEALHKKEGRS